MERPPHNIITGIDFFSTFPNHIGIVYANQTIISIYIEIMHDDDVCMLSRYAGESQVHQIEDESHIYILSSYVDDGN
jgi:hypothetical protein